MSRRSRVKYPALRRDMNVKSRRYCIETEYINGVRNEHGRMVMRPLTDSEKAFLNKFYEETVVTTFKKDGTDLYPESEDRKMFYHENYIRNVDLYNLKQRTGMLKFDHEILETMIRNPYYFLDPEEYVMLSHDGEEDT